MELTEKERWHHSQFRWDEMRWVMWMLPNTSIFSAGPVTGCLRVNISCHFAPGGVHCIVMSLSVCMCVCSRNSKTARPNVTKFLTHVARGRALVLLWRHCDMLCTSGFVGDVILSHNGRMANHVYSWAAIEHDKLVTRAVPNILFVFYSGRIVGRIVYSYSAE